MLASPILPVSVAEGAPMVERQEKVSAGKHVLLLGSFAPSLVNFRGELIAAMVVKGCRVIAAAPAMDETTAERLCLLGAEPLSIEFSNTSLNPLDLLRSCRELRGIIRTYEPDLILSYTIKPVIIGALAGRAEGVSRIVSLITGLGFAFTGSSNIGKRRIARLAASVLYRLALSRSDMVLFQNKDDQALFRDLGLLNVKIPAAVIAGSGVDLHHFAPAPVPESVSFLMIARLLGDKGIREFAAAARRLRREHPDVPIALAGYLDSSPDAICRRELEEIVGWGISFYGKLEDVRPAIADCSVYVLPSYREGTPRSVLEAMAMGRAIITTDAPGCRDTVVDGLNGLLVRPRDAESLYAAMKRFVDEPDLASQMGAESRKMAERLYDAKKVSADIIRYANL